MKSPIVTSILLVLFTSMQGQNLHLDVEGHARIRGYMDIAHMDDTTSMFIGKDAGANMDLASSKSATMVGVLAGFNNTTGNNNSFFGHTAGMMNLTGGGNSFFGTESGEHNTTGGSNSFFGAESGENNTEGYQNSFFGSNAGYENIDGARNSFFGEYAGYNNETGSSNSFFGEDAGSNIESGSYNSFFGAQSGNSNKVSFANTFVGYEAGQLNSSDTVNNATAIGYLSFVNCSDCAVIGGTGPNAVNLGLGTRNPETLLHISEESSGSTFLHDNTAPGSTANSVSLTQRLRTGVQSRIGFKIESNFTTIADANRSSSAGFFTAHNGNLSERLTIKGNDVGIDCTDPDHDLTIGGSGSGCNTGTFSEIDKGETQFTASSSRSLKEHFIKVESDDILEKIGGIPVYVYDFIDGPKNKMGLVAEDFYTVFARGSDKRINGNEVTMALWLSTQQLTEQVKELNKENVLLRERLDQMSRQLDQLVKEK